MVGLGFISKGSAFNCSFVDLIILLTDKQPAYALTFVEVLFLQRDDFDHVMEDWPAERKLVRRACCFMAMRRGILFAAKVIHPIREKYKDIPWEQLQPELENKLYQVPVLSICTHLLRRILNIALTT